VASVVLDAPDHGGYRDVLQAYDVATGRALWTQPIDPGSRVPHVTREAVDVVAEPSGSWHRARPRLLRLDLQTGKVLRELTLEVADAELLTFALEEGPGQTLQVTVARCWYGR
jgi:hypothetical protein